MTERYFNCGKQVLVERFDSMLNVAQAENEALVITVRDHGPGLPASVKGREQTLFEKFTRGQSESSTRGVGLGLAICKAVVDAHRGSIRAADAAGGGAEFTVRLPRRPPPLAPA